MNFHILASFLSYSIVAGVCAVGGVVFFILFARHNAKVVAAVTKAVDAGVADIKAKIDVKP